jgi:hypothetical protein
MSLLLEAVFHHLVLPPKLPDSFDGDNADLARALGERMQNAVDGVHGLDDRRVKNALTSSLQATRALNDSSLYQEEMLQAFQFLGNSNDNGWLGIHITSQNAALMVHRDLLSVLMRSVVFKILTPRIGTMAS